MIHTAPTKHLNGESLKSALADMGNGSYLTRSLSPGPLGVKACARSLVAAAVVAPILFMATVGNQAKLGVADNKPAVPGHAMTLDA
jgi:hypothetical protein